MHSLHHLYAGLTIFVTVNPTDMYILNITCLVLFCLLKCNPEDFCFLNVAYLFVLATIGHFVFDLRGDKRTDKRKWKQ